ncbi:DUF6447 family protein [Massilia sp. G4R7]|uniref:DUF6447 family protein n=1 Tax=Massilia phyllostachyos TaxID=2898585 RepID=A0ABS8Q7F2_9BURK|nr:DUF6447 family protein [Massilia phyllostachyos]MCD2517678.1 DUF6447 family protein [Massilia phyllostachyos]
MSSPLLPNEPRVAKDGVQAALTARHLLPVLAQFEACLLYLRAEVDPVLRGRLPVKLGKPYPLGQCLEISKAMQERLATVEEAEVPPDAAVGLRALRSFQRAGGAMRQVWGDLRGQYFQNAFQIGTLYVDVSNDTVTVTKPKVEVLPFEQARFSAIRDYRHFARVAESYWGETAYPNHVLPQLAPHCPLVMVNKSGRIQLRAATDYMLALTRSQAFAPSEALLRDEPMPQEVFERVRQALQGSGQVLAPDPAQGRQLALAQCRRQRGAGAHRSPAAHEAVIREAQAVNQALGMRTNPSNQTSTENPMSTIKIDAIDYPLDSLSPEARAQLQSIQFVDAELARMQAHMAALQTARAAYVAALKAALPAA